LRSQGQREAVGRTFGPPVRGGLASVSHDDPEPKKKHAPRLTPGLHAALLAAAFVIFAFPVALTSGVIAGAVGAIAGTFLAESLCRTRYRLHAITLFGLGIAALGVGLSSLVSSTQPVASVFGGTFALGVADALRFLGLAAGGSLVLRASAIRFRAALSVEGCLVVLAVAVTVAAHRDGMIARPLEVSDWFWTQGIDPVVAFLGIGLLGALLLAGILAYGRSKRTIVQIAMLLVLGVLIASQLHGRDFGDPRDVLGKSQKDKEQEQKERDAAKSKVGGGGGSGGQQGNQPRTPFDQDDLPRPGTGRGQNRPAAIVVFHRGVQPATGIFYFRHAAFSQYNGTRLVEATIAGVDLDARHSFPTTKIKIPGVPDDEATRTLVATDIALLSDHTRMFMLDDGVEAEPMPNPDPARFRRAYRVVSSILTSPLEDLLGLSPGDETWSEEAWEHYTTLPHDERYHSLAAELQGRLRSEFQSDPLALALTVKQHLEEVSTYSFVREYTGSDPTAEFLFSEDKKGYCVHLAHATAYLLRAMGVPTRVSAGYAVPAANLGGGSSLLIKGSDAHAWAEIYLAGVGWVPIEVTPEKTDIEPTPFAERDLQSLLGEMARREGRTTREPAQSAQILKAILKAMMAVIPWILIGLLALAYTIKLWRLASPWIAARRHQPLVAYRAGLDRLSAIGFVRESGESRERFAGRASALAPSFAPLTAVHVGVALGSRQERQRAEDLPRLTIGVGKEVRKSVPVWRWVLGALNPVSWLWSR
jgi:protein-glutamine gamma-glutamyltransferase